MAEYTKLRENFATNFNQQKTIMDFICSPISTILIQYKNEFCTSEIIMVTSTSLCKTIESERILLKGFHFHEMKVLFFSVITNSLFFFSVDFPFYLLFNENYTVKTI